MDFLLWATRSLHIFCVVVWLGGLMYQAVTTLPVAKAEQSEFSGFTRHMLRHFVPFVWMCVWTILVTGVALMLFSPKFVFFQYNDSWSVLLGLKQLTFMIMVVFSFGYARMFKRLDDLLSVSANEPLDQVMPFYERMLQFGRINVAFGILAILITSGL